MKRKKEHNGKIVTDALLALVPATSRQAVEQFHLAIRAAPDRVFFTALY